jgi:membrane protease YdiL (CAAX protease family)
MLFLLKARWTTACLGLAVLTLLGIVLKVVGHARGWPEGASPGVTATAVLIGIGAVAIVLTSDGVVHGLSCLVFGEKYLRRYRELAGLFRGQTYAAIVAGALMAGIGEELVFRGLSLSPIYLFGGAVVFGLLHHVRRDFWPFTIWAIWEGMLFAAALYATEMLCVTMFAHFLHDLIGFLIFRHVNRVDPSTTSA